MDSSLLVLTGSQRGQVLDLAQSPFSVGRHPLCQFRPACPLVSRHHCTILHRDGKLFVRDLFSRNGTFVNGRRIADEVELQPGDQILIGSVFLAVCPRADTPASQAADAEPVPTATTVAMPGPDALPCEAVGTAAPALPGLIRVSP